MINNPILTTIAEFAMTIATLIFLLEVEIILLLEYFSNLNGKIHVNPEPQIWVKSLPA